MLGLKFKISKIYNSFNTRNTIARRKQRQVWARYLTKLLNNYHSIWETPLKSERGAFESTENSVSIFKIDFRVSFNVHSEFIRDSLRSMIGLFDFLFSNHMIFCRNSTYSHYKTHSRAKASAAEPFCIMFYISTPRIAMRSTMGGLVLNLICLAWLVAVVVAQTDQPSASPSFAPSFSPSSAPSASPSYAPSSAPSASPTAEDTNGFGSSDGTLAPTAVPTELTTNRPGCIISALVECENEFGVDCKIIDPPSPACGTGALSSLSFTYDSLSECDDSLNQQDDEILGMPTCIQEGTLAEQVGITCEGLHGASTMGDPPVALTVSPSILSSGEELTVTPTTASTIPEFVSCTVYSLNDGSFDAALQRVLISTSEPFYLKETYGSLQVQSCDDEVCLQEVTFTYTVTNDGETTAEVTELIRDCDLVTDPSDIFSLLTQTTLAPGESGSYSETFTVDVCEGGASLGASVQAAANDDRCQADYEFEATPDVPTCAVDVEVDCSYEGSGGTDESCESLASSWEPKCLCEDGCVRELEFLVTGSGCSGNPPTDGSLLLCNDYDVTPTSGEIYIMMTGMDGSMYYNDYAEIGKTITISAPGCVFSEISFYTAQDMFFSKMFQTTSFQHRCSSGGMALGTQFGSITFTGYSCANGSEESCLKDVTYTACGYNEGLVPTTLTSMTLTRDDTTTSILEGSPVLPTGGEYCGSETVSVDFCDEDDLGASVALEAGPPGKECQASTDFEIDVTSAPTPVPTEQTNTRAPVGVPTYPSKGYYAKGYIGKGKGKGMKKKRNGTFYITNKNPGAYFPRIYYSHNFSFRRQRKGQR